MKSPIRSASRLYAAAAAIVGLGPVFASAHSPTHPSLLPPLDSARLLSIPAPDLGAPGDETYAHLVDILRDLSPREREIISRLYRDSPPNMGMDTELPPELLTGSGGPEMARLEAALDDAEVPAALADTPRAGPLLAGTAVMDVTPPQGCPLGGTGRWRDNLLVHDNELDPNWYAKFFWPPEGVNDPVLAKALVLDNGDRKVVLVGLDAIGFSAHFFRLVTDRLTDLGIHRENYFITATHNHAGPGDMNRLPFLWFGAMDVYDPRIALPFVEKLEALIRRAVADLEPARLGYNTGPDLIGLSKNSRGDVEKVDPTIGVLKILRADGSAKAGLFNFAAHGDALDREWPFISRDWSGFAEDAIEAELGEGTVFFHVNGAEGDQVPDGHGRNHLEEARWVGESMADQVVELWNQTSTTDQVELDVAREIRWMGTPRSHPGIWTSEYPQIPWWITVPLNRLVESVAKVSALRINDLLIHTVPGEPIHDIGVKIRAHALSRGFPQAWTFGLTNNYIAYITTWEEFWDGEYQAAATLFGPHTGLKMIRTSERVINEIADRWSPSGPEGPTGADTPLH